jgi:hypothetical protein
MRPPDNAPPPRGRQPGAGQESGSNRRPEDTPDVDWVTLTAGLLDRYPDIPPERLAAPTLGAYRRAHGLGDGWTAEGLHLFAVTLAEEARRFLVFERLAGIVRFLEIGGSVDQATTQLVALTNTLTSGSSSAAAA